MSIFSMLRVTRQIQEPHTGHKVVTAPLLTSVRPPAPPPAGNLSSGHLPDWMATKPLPVEAQVVLRIMGEDIPGAVQILRQLTPRDRAVFRFYLEETQRTINNVDQSEGRF